MYRRIKIAVLCTASLAGVALYAQDRDRAPQRYEDKGHHDTHEWNDKEDSAYRKYLDEHHRKYHEFGKASKKEQQNYWNWRHSHPD